MRNRDVDRLDFWVRKKTTPHSLPNLITTVDGPETRLLICNLMEG